MIFFKNSRSSSLCENLVDFTSKEVEIKIKTYPEYRNLNWRSFNNNATAIPTPYEACPSSLNQQRNKIRRSNYPRRT